MRGTSTTLAALAALALLGAAPRTARAQDLDGVRLLLGAFHEPPTAEALARAAADPYEALEQVVGDEGELMLLRRRAVTALGELSDPRVEPLLVELVAASAEPELRRAAASALERRLVETEPDRLVSLLSPLLESADPLDRELAVWLLARISSPRGRQLLERRRIVERNRAVVEALRRSLAQP